MCRPLYDAVLVQPCGHSMSAEAAEKWKGSCPECRGVIEKIVPNRGLRDIVLGLLQRELETMDEQDLAEIEPRLGEIDAALRAEEKRLEEREKVDKRKLRAEQLLKEKEEKLADLRAK